MDTLLPMCGTARSCYFAMVKRLFEVIYDKPNEEWVYECDGAKQ